MTAFITLDTSTDGCSVALQVNGKVTSQFEIAPRRHTDIVLTMLKQLLTEAQCQIKDVDAIAFGCGPGSFMGVRLATGVAQGLAFGAGVPVIPISSLQVLAQTAFQATKVNNIVAAWDARMAEVYWGIYQANADGIMMPVQGDVITPPQDIYIPEDKYYLLAGNAWQAYETDIASHLSDRHYDIKTDCYPHAEAMLVLAEYYFAAGKAMPPEKAEPSYLRNDVATKKSS